MNDDRVFKALADATRRYLLDLLFARDGQTLTELESRLEMTRFGVMKHLRVLGPRASSSRAVQAGRSCIPEPGADRLLHNRWIHKYAEHQVSALAEPKRIGGKGMSTDTKAGVTTQGTRLHQSHCHRPSRTRLRRRNGR